VELIYLDYNCFQRGFDDPGQVRVQLEALACEEVFALAAAGKVQLAWSFVHVEENDLCPFPDRKEAASALGARCVVRVGPDDDIRGRAKSLERDGLSPRDASHVACALACGASAFLTCDVRLLRKARQLALPLRVLNPLDYVRSTLENGTSTKDE
jgi:hypothetical protein